MIPGIQNFPEGQIIAFALILLRIIAFVIAWPIFGSQQVPTPIKILLAVVLTVVIYPTVKFQNIDLIKINDQIIFLSVREIFVGLCLGFLLRFFFFAVSISGEMMGISSGLSSAQLYNPAMGTQSNVLEHANVILATLLILAMNGHHMFIQGLAQSFELVPIADVAVKSTAFSGIAVVTQEAFFMGIKMASPIIVTMFLANVTMGLLGRAVPQLNVMMTSFHVTITLAIFVFFITVPLFVSEMQGLLQMMTERFFNVMRVL